MPAPRVILFNCLFYAGGHILYLLSLKTLVKEAISVIVYIRVFNTVAKVLFVGKSPAAVSEEKVSLALMITVVSLIGSIGADIVVSPLWILSVLTVQYCRGLQPAMALSAVIAVFSRCENGSRRIWNFSQGLWRRF